MADLQTRFEALHQNVEQRFQKTTDRINEVVRNFETRIQTEDDNIHQFEMRLNTTLEERLQEYSAQINKSFQTIAQQYTPISMHEEVDQAVANCVPIQNFNDLHGHVKKLQARLSDLDDAFSENQHEMVQFQAQLVAKIEEIVVQCDELNTTAARERENERAERVQQIEELRRTIQAEHTETHNQLVKEHEEMCKLHEEETREIHDLLAQEGKVRQEALDSESITRARDDQELNTTLRRLITEAGNQESDVRNTQLQELAQRLNKNIEADHEAWKQALQEMNAMLRAFVSESVTHESNERGIQQQDMMRKLQELCNRESDERNNQFEELYNLLRNLEASHTELSFKHSDGHQKHVDNHGALETLLEEHREQHQKNIEAERKERAQELENHGELLRQIENLVGQETNERNAQVQDLLRRMDSSYGAHENALAQERRTKEEQFANFQNAMQNLSRETADERKVRGDAIDAVQRGAEGLKQEIGAKISNLKEEVYKEDEKLRKQIGEVAASTREHVYQMCEGTKEDSAKKVATVQGSINGLQTALEADRMAFREAREEQMRTVQSEREARNRQNAELRADYKREIMKEHQDRMDHVADQRKDIFKSLRGGGPGGSYNPNLTAVEGPNLGPGQGSDKGSGPQFGSLEGLSDLDKKHSINSLGQRLSLMGNISPKPTIRTPQPGQ